MIELYPTKCKPLFSLSEGEWWAVFISILYFSILCFGPGKQTIY